MNKQQFKQIQAIVVSFLGLLIAVSVLRDTYLLAAIGVSGSILVLVIARRQLSEIITDERTALIQQKASTMTLSIVSVSSAFVGLLMVEMSYRGYPELGGYGYFLAYYVMGVMTLNVILTWYYGTQMGD